jgi:hypothetical protein
LSTRNDDEMGGRGLQIGAFWPVLNICRRHWNSPIVAIEMTTELI